MRSAPTNCGDWEVALSAVADGEDPGVDRRLVDAHLDRCVGCASYAAALERLGHHATVRTSPQMPDLSGQVSRLVAVADRARTWVVVRILLGLIALGITIDAIPALVMGHDGEGTSHAARHYGAFTVAYAVALMAAVVRPARARTILPVAFVTAMALSVTAVIDAVEGHIPLLGEAKHLPELASVVLVWLLARPAPDQAFADSGDVAALRLVGSEEHDGEPRSKHREAG